MSKKKQTNLDKLKLSGPIIKWGGIATAIAAIVTLLFTFFPNLRPTLRSNVLKVEFTGALSPQKDSLRQYLATIGITESQALGSSSGGSVGPVDMSNPRRPRFGPKATAGQIKELRRPFSATEINKMGLMFKVPMKFIGTEGKKYYLEWALLDASNTEVYTSRTDFFHEIEIQYQAGDDTFSEIWVPTEGLSGVFFVRVQIFDEARNPVAFKDSEKIPFL